MKPFDRRHSFRWIATLGTTLVCAIGAGVLVVWGGRGPATNSEDASNRLAPEGGASDADHELSVSIIPRSYDAWEVFDELECMGGPGVAMLGVKKRALSVPRGLRFRPVEGGKLVEAVAASGRLKLVWTRGGRSAVLYEGVPDMEIEQVRKGLASTDVAERRDAAWRAGWLRDVRAVPLLTRASKDGDMETSRQAIVSLRRLGWPAVLAVDSSVTDLIASELGSQDSSDRVGAASALSLVDAEEGLALVKRALTDESYNVRDEAIHALGRMRRESFATAVSITAMAEDALAGQDAGACRQVAAAALRRATEDTTMVFLKKALGRRSAELRCQAVHELGRAAIETPAKRAEILSLIEEMMTDEDESVRLQAGYALGYVGGPKASALIERALKSEDKYVRGGAVGALARLGDRRAQKFLEEALLVRDHEALKAACIVLSCMNEADALAFIEKAMAARDPFVRFVGIGGLRTIGGDSVPPSVEDRVLELVEKGLVDEKDDVRRVAMLELLYFNSDKTLGILERAVTDSDEAVRKGAMGAVRELNRHEALELIDKALTSVATDVRRDAISALAEIGGHEAVERLAALVSAEDSSIRWEAAIALGRVGGGGSLVILEKALVDQDARVRKAAVESLGLVGGDKAVALLVDKALSDQDSEVRDGAGEALSRAGSAKALELLEQGLASQDGTVRARAARALGNVGGQEACDLLLRQLATEKDKGVVLAIGDALAYGFVGNPMVGTVLENSGSAVHLLPNPESQE